MYHCGQQQSLPTLVTAPKTGNVRAARGVRVQKCHEWCWLCRGAQARRLFRWVGRSNSGDRTQLLCAPALLHVGACSHPGAQGVNAVRAAAHACMGYTVHATCPSCSFRWVHHRTQSPVSAVARSTCSKADRRPLCQRWGLLLLPLAPHCVVV